MLRQRPPKTKQARGNSPSSKFPLASSGPDANPPLEVEVLPGASGHARRANWADDRVTRQENQAALQKEETKGDEMDYDNMSRKSQWIVLAVASGACAAFNGVFAKLYVR